MALSYFKIPSPESPELEPLLRAGTLVRVDRTESLRMLGTLEKYWDESRATGRSWWEGLEPYLRLNRDDLTAQQELRILLEDTPFGRYDFAVTLRPSGSIGGCTADVLSRLDLFCSCAGDLCVFAATMKEGAIVAELEYFLEVRANSHLFVKL
jgi:hypothetical protein